MLPWTGAPTVMPHDAYVLAVLGDERQFAAWLRTVLSPAQVASIGWSSLHRVGERHAGIRLRVGSSDLVFAAELADGAARLLVVFEHRSTAASDLHDTLLRYAVHLLHAAGRERPWRPTFVAVVVLSHGAAPPALQPRAVLSSGAGLATAWAGLQPQVVVLRHHLAACSNSMPQAGELPPATRLMLVALASLPGLDGPATLAALGRWAELLRATEQEDRQYGSEHLAAFFWYLLLVSDTPLATLQAAVVELLPSAKTTIMSTGERLLAKGRSEGRLQGRVEGRVEGWREGQIMVLRRLCERRFGELPPAVQARLEAASAADLERWIDRVLDAASLAELFASR